MKTKHTKGNWFAEVNKAYCVTENNKTYQIATCDTMSVGLPQAEENAKLIASAPKLLQRVEDLEQGILRFITHLDDFRGNYEREELALLRKLVTIDRPYFPPVSYHDNWTGKEAASTENIKP